MKTTHIRLKVTHEDTIRTDTICVAFNKWFDNIAIPLIQIEGEASCFEILPINPKTMPNQEFDKLSRTVQLHLMRLVPLARQLARE